MNRYPVDYPYIRSVGYEIDDNTIEIEFEEGSIYQYFNVPEELYWKFREVDQDFELDTVPVKSSLISEIGYDADMEIVLVELRRGEIFLYLGIEEDVFEKFVNSSSQGSFLNRTLKYAGYRHRKVGKVVKVDSIVRKKTPPEVSTPEATVEQCISEAVALGLMFFSGTNGIQDYCEAAKWLKNAVELFNINKGLFAGSKDLEIVPISIDPENNYRSLAHQGNADAQTNLGLLYINGHGQALAEFMEAGKWFNESIKIGLINLSPLALVAFDGTGLANKNAVVALEWFTLAAKQGHPNAQYQLGKLYYTGEGVEQSYKESVVWYEKAAELGHTEAQNALGGAYHIGVVESNYSLALHWYSEAAVKGHKRALYNLGMLYFEGKGVEKDLYKSLIYITAAKQLGNENAINFVDVFINEGLESEIIQQINFAATELLKTFSTTSKL